MPSSFLKVKRYYPVRLWAASKLMGVRQLTAEGLGRFGCGDVTEFRLLLCYGQSSQVSEGATRMSKVTGIISHIGQATQM